MLCAFETPEASVALVHVMGCCADLGGFVNSHGNCLHPQIGSGRECWERVCTNTLN